MTENKKPKNFFHNFNLEKMVAFSLAVLVVSSVLIIVIVIFIPSSDEQFSELSLYIYREDLGTYVTYGYPAGLYTDRNESIFFVVKNFENKVVYYQLQIKLTKLSQNLSTMVPLSSSSSYQMYPNDTYEKILSCATKAEKESPSQFSDYYIWEPTNTTLFVNEDILLFLGGDRSIKIVFELWKFNTNEDTFVYSGVFTFLELFVIEV
ncbi:MAG: DUF1616 domain-containing protein [Candidatus Heimdallarchaeota archaeon]|nr:DUF1616 domain-containing protein [Candidatus Heimdallarchaeota archaeon]MCK4878120.1 DUF1616 domain-containing protein [Candidatus Heimdallarchaeota archaeon]